MIVLTPISIEEILRFDGDGFDATRIRFPTHVDVDGVDYVFYSGTPFFNNREIGLITSSDG